MQLGNDSQYHPVAYFSNAVKPSQENWNTTTKEAFAVVLAVRHWYVYLMSTNFTLNTDHNPLVYLRLQKDPRGKFARWIIELEEFNYTIKYIPGIKNTKADTLSRNKAAKPTTQPLLDLEEKIYSVSINDTNFMQQLQEEQTKDLIITRRTNKRSHCYKKNKQKIPLLQEEQTKDPIVTRRTNKRSHCYKKNKQKIPLLAITRRTNKRSHCYKKNKQKIPLLTITRRTNKRSHCYKKNKQKIPLLAITRRTNKRSHCYKKNKQKIPLLALPSKVYHPMR